MYKTDFSQNDSVQIYLPIEYNDGIRTNINKNFKSSTGISEIL